MESAPGSLDCPDGSAEITNQAECIMAVKSLGYALMSDDQIHVGVECSFPNGCSFMATLNSIPGASNVQAYFSPPSKTCENVQPDQKRACRFSESELLEHTCRLRVYDMCHPL